MGHNLIICYDIDMKKEKTAKLNIRSYSIGVLFYHLKKTERGMYFVVEMMLAETERVFSLELGCIYRRTFLERRTFRRNLCDYFGEEFND